ncbi:MAG: hypothetical protein J5716_00450 [Alphaproteobacteria bacterium]|nr:hypothetical protein [Alphaproteobacteria bacterium]
MKIFFLAFLTAFVFAGSAFAQVVDVRAASFRRGNKAYHAPAPAAVQTETVQPKAFRQNTEKNVRSDTSTQKQTKKEQTRIQQNGYKIFQEKDEDKVMNFNVDNPEFEKLSKHQQQDLLNRIKFE